MPINLDNRLTMSADGIGGTRIMATTSTNRRMITTSSKIVGWPVLCELREQWRRKSQIVVWTNGCFDLFHVGHLRSLLAARALGDVLVVGVNSDASVATLKGPHRPIFPAMDRMELLAGLSSVDCVIAFDELTPEVALARLQPDVHCKGADYAPPRGKPIPEARIVEDYGGRVAFLPMVPVISTSELIQRISALPKSSR